MRLASAQAAGSSERESEAWVNLKKEKSPEREARSVFEPPFQGSVLF